MTFEEIFDEQARKTKLLISEEYISKVATPKLDYYDDLFENDGIEYTVKEFLRTCKCVGLSLYYGGV